MDNRLTRPGIDADQTAVRFMGEAVKIQNIGDKVLELILNGPTINSVNKDTLRHLVRQLYTELKCYEDTGLEPEELSGLLRSPVYIAACVLNGAAISHERAIEIAKAEVEGRLFIPPIKPGEAVYWLLDDDGWYVSDPNKVADVGTKGFYTNGVMDLVNLSDHLDFTPWDEIGKTVFLSREEAEAALAKMKEG